MDLSDTFLNMVQKAQRTKTKINRWDYNQQTEKIICRRGEGG